MNKQLLTICALISLFVFMTAVGCNGSAQVKTSRFPWINTWGVEYYKAEGQTLRKDASYFDIHLSPHNIKGMKSVSPNSKSFLYQIWREQYVNDEEGALKERRKLRKWTSANKRSPENFYCHYGRDVTIKGRNPQSHKEESIIIPGWDGDNDRNGDGARDLPSDYGRSTSTGKSFLEDTRKDWRDDQWVGAVLVDRNGRTYNITGNTDRRIKLASGSPASGRYGISASGSANHYATARNRYESRVKTYIWENYAYAMNIGNSDYQNYRAYDARKLIVEGDTSWDSDANSLWDGFMIDNTQPEFPWAEVIDGTEVILEYPIKSKWRGDQVKLFKVVRNAVGDRKLLIGNTASYDYVEIADVGGGQHQEQYVAFTNEHGPAQWDYWKQQSSKGYYSLVLPSYGAYEKDPDRERMHYLAFHYIGQQPYIYLGFRGFGYREVYKWSPNPEDWLAAAEVDVGRPVESSYKLVGSGKDPAGQDYRIYSRRYSLALIVCRPKIKWSHENYGNETGVTYNLPSYQSGEGRSNLYRPLLANGKLGSPVSKVVLKHPESYILFPADK